MAILFNLGTFLLGIKKGYSSYENSGNRWSFNGHALLYASLYAHTAHIEKSCIISDKMTVFIIYESIYENLILIAVQEYPCNLTYLNTLVVNRAAWRQINGVISLKLHNKSLRLETRRVRNRLGVAVIEFKPVTRFSGL